MSKKANGHKAPLRLSNVPSSCKAIRQKSIQTQSRYTPQKGIVIPYKCYITYKPNYVHRRISPHIGRTAYASEKESVHRINYDFYIPQDTVYVKRQIFKMWCFIGLRRIFIMRIMYIFRADHRFMISTIRIAAV